MQIIESAKAIEPHLVELRREFHRHPELSEQEKETSERVLRELEAIGGYHIRSHVGGYGILAEITGTASVPPTASVLAGNPVSDADATAPQVVALRADMDALSIREDTGLPCSSEQDGVMHACGHDHHITILLGAARLLRKYQQNFHGTVRLIFQPAEELSPTGGSRRMIEEGALDGVKAVFGLHVWPNLPAGVVGCKAGPQMAASDRFSVDFEGESSHGAMPDQGNDALVAGAQFVTAVQSIIARNKNPMKAGVVTIGVFQSGSRYNIVPGSCHLEGTVRTFDPEVRTMIEKRLNTLFEGIRDGFSMKGEFQYHKGYTSVRNDPAMADFALETAGELFGDANAVRLEEPAMTAEDFAFYLEKVPGAFVWLGTTPEGDPVWPLHSAHYAGNEDVLWRGAALLASLAMKQLKADETVGEEG